MHSLRLGLFALSILTSTTACRATAGEPLPPAAAEPSAEPAEPQAEEPEASHPSKPLEELRGLWVTRWTFASPDDVDRVLEDTRSAGFNAVYFQVRGRFDALYASELEPWAVELTGTLGKDPGWDPLAYAVEAAHARGLQIHAWLNTYPLWSGAVPPRSSGIPHPLETHPDWVVADATGKAMPLGESYVFASPGNPEVRTHVVAVIADIAARYDVDGIHLDYLRYPGAEYSHDLPALAAWGKQGDLGEWQRAQILETLAAARASLDVPLTAAVWGVYDNPWQWPKVSEGNKSFYQDTRGYFAAGVLDAAMPMIYWPVTDPPGQRLDFATLAADHVRRAGDRHVYAGIDANKLTWPQVERAIEASREAGAHGFVLFEYKAVRDKGWIDDLSGGPFATPAVPPPMPWRTPRSP